MMNSRKILMLALSSMLAGQPSFGQARDYNVTPVPFNKVQITDDFWAGRIETNKRVTIPIAFGHCESTGRINNFKIAVSAGRTCSWFREGITG